jgi:energy-coupling factor transporter ATP-binding protein EcfA2
MTSNCYKDKSNTAEQWIEEVENKGLSCVAVTDHNDYRGISSIKEVAAPKGITVFPGVEVTCDSSKIHIIVLFDVSKTEDKVRDFLSAIDIDSDLVGTSEGTTRSVFEICEKAKQKGALVIAAHIDEYNGINSMGPTNLSKILDRRYIDAVQVVNNEIWGVYKTKSDEAKMLELLKIKYEKDIPADEAHKWRKTFNKAKEKGFPILSFSDNPYAEGKGEHGLWGIGKRFTWIKMDQFPNLESLRQAFLSEDMRIVLDIDSSSCPEKIADYWIKYVRISETTINPNKEIYTEFSPQLNAIIGGRGSGKSTIIRMIAGALGAENKNDLKTITEEQNNFYKKTDTKSKLGVFNGNSQIEIGLLRHNIEYRLFITNIQNSNKQTRRLFKLKEDGSEEEILDANYIEFFRPLIYTQKQIFEIAKDQDALLKIIDGGIDEMPLAQEQKAQVYEQLLSKMSEINLIENAISKEGKLRTELDDINNQIKQYKDSGISAILDEKQKLVNDKRIVDELTNSIEENVKKVTTVLENVDFPDRLDELSDDNLKALVETARTTILSIFEQTKQAMEKVSEVNQELGKAIDESSWITKCKENANRYTEACTKLAESNLDANKLDELLTNQENKIKELREVQRQKVSLEERIGERKILERQYMRAFKHIRELRKQFVESVLGSEENVRIEIHPHRNQISFENMIKEYTQKEGVGISNDIEALSKDIFGKGGIESFRNISKNVRAGNDEKKLSAVLKKALRDMDEKVFNKLISFVPEDEIEVQYKPKKGKAFLPLSSASAGQKTTAILTFVLAYGNKPLLLDQPEDDLDNKLVFDLVVKRLKRTKACRQLIIVTHNANIPVNGDAEYITSMNSDSRYVEVKNQGTIDNEDVRREICDVMEGTEYAFEMRAKKYHLRIVE